MTRGKARFRRVVAALLALALLVLPGTPMRHASAAAPVADRHAAHLCAGHDPAPPQDQALATDHQDGGQPCEYPGASPGMGCCASAQCSATAAAVPPVAPGHPVPPSGLRMAGGAVPGLPDGIAVDPALHPPRLPA